MFRVRQIITNDLPKVILGTAKTIIWLPSRAINSALNYSRVYGLSKNACEEFGEKAAKAKLHKECNQMRKKELSLPSIHYPYTMLLDMYFYHKAKYGHLEHSPLDVHSELDEDTFCDRKLLTKMVHRNQVFERIMNLSDLSLTHTSEADISCSEDDESLDLVSAESVEDDEENSINLESAVSVENSNLSNLTS
jgi:hypothetical protein